MTKRESAPAAAAAALPLPAGAVFELTQRFHFDAAHTLRRAIETEGSLRIHGHTYTAEVTVSGVPDPHTGMVTDLAHLRQEIARVRDMLDHHFLDEVPGIGPATLENLCAFIARQLAGSVAGLCGVRVARESSGDRCVMRWGGLTKYPALDS